MPKYLINASYTAAGVKGLLKEGGTSRAASIGELIASLGGKMEAFYFAFGADDAVVIADFPDNATSAALSLNVGASGFASTSTTVLLTPAEADAACKVKVAYRPPGAPKRAARKTAAKTTKAAKKA